MNLPLNVDLRNKVAVITGAGGVLCSEFARALAASGAKVALLNRSTDKINDLEKELKEEGYIAKAYQCDVLDKENLQNVHDQIVNDLGLCDILVNGAGGNHPRATTDNEYYELEDSKDIRTFFDLDKDDIEHVFNLNYLGSLLPTQVFALDMVNRKGCSIINISSMNAYTPLTKIPAYSGAKAAVSNFTEWLAVHFSKVGIRCNGIAPGFFSTKQNEKLLFDENGEPTERTNKILSGTPMNRFGKPNELLGVLLFLASEEASGFVNGVVIPVDGGFSAYSGV